MKNIQLVNILKKLSILTKNEIFFGPQGFALATTKQALEKVQHGFNTYPNGSSIPSADVGNWQSNWLVIATDTELGDPYFVDTESEKHAVYTAMLSEDGWQVEQVATSLNSFINCMKALAESNKQINATIIPDENTLFDTERLTVLKNKLIKLSSCENFWTLFFECYFDWLEDLDDE